MQHKFKPHDISGVDYYEVKDDQFRAVFRQIGFDHDKPILLPGAMSLRKSPTGWMDKAEAYLKDNGFEVL